MVHIFTFLFMHVVQMLMGNVSSSSSTWYTFYEFGSSQKRAALPCRIVQSSPAPAAAHAQLMAKIHIVIQAAHV